jgi:hypothetical protein
MATRGELTNRKVGRFCFGYAGSSANAGLGSHAIAAIREVQNPRPPVLTGAIPPGIPELIADLKRDDRLTRAGRKRQEQPALPLQDRLDRAVDGNLLVIAR